MDSPPPNNASPPRPDGRLDSWKAIASHLKRSVRTVQQWEKDEGLPVRRQWHQRRGTVYAYTSEIDTWWATRRAGLEHETVSTPRIEDGRLRWFWRRFGWVAVPVAVLALAFAVIAVARHARSTSESAASVGLVVASGPPLRTPGSLAISPDGATLYVSDWGAQAIFVVPASGGRPRLLASRATTGFAGLESARFMAISPDGETLYVAGWSSASVFSVSTSTGQTRVLASGPPLRRPHGIATSSDGTILFVTDNYGGKLFSLPAAGGVPSLLADGLTEPLDVAAIGTTLYITCGVRSLRAVQGAGGQARVVKAGRPFVRPTGATASPDGSLLFVVDDAGFAGRPPAAIYAVTIATGSLERLFAGPPLMYPADAVISPDGASLFVADAGYGADGAIYRLDLYKPLTIDIEPGRPGNEINPMTHDVISIAVLTTATSNAKEVDRHSVRFGPRQAQEIHGQGHVVDVDQDGDQDLLLHFAAVEAGVPCGATQATLRARNIRGAWSKGSDAVKTIRCRSSSDASPSREFES